MTRNSIFVLLFWIGNTIIAQELTVIYNTQKKLQHSSVKKQSRPKKGASQEEVERYYESFSDLSDQSKDELPSVFNYKTVLRVDGERSLYYPKDKISNDTLVKQQIQKEGNFTHTEIRYKDHGIVYKDLDSKIAVSTVYETTFGKTREFLIKENLETFNWILINEKRNIRGYTCKKAILTDHHKDQEESRHHSHDHNIEVWYTQEIDIAQGPDEFWGLPGLIIEVRKAQERITVDKISFNIDGFNVVPPTKGKMISRDDLQNLPAILFNEQN